MGQKSLLQKVQILFFLSSVIGVFYGREGGWFFLFFFVSKIASDMIEWMNGW